MRKINYLILLLVFANSMNAQEIGIGGVKLWTDNSEIQNPMGVGIYLYQKIWELGIKAEYTYTSNEREYFGRIISGFTVIPDNYYPESVISKSYHHSLELDLIVPKIIEYAALSLNLGMGVHHNEFSGERKGLSSKNNVKLNSENKFGVSYFMSISREGIFIHPLKIELLFKYKNSFGNIYVTDSEQPFRGDIFIKALYLNISYNLTGIH